jgi:phenylalanyl-tRNA synthetase beta chain
MRVPLSWLRDYVDFDLSAEQLAERLTELGFELQALEQVGQDWSSVVVGELLEVVPHPTANSLSLTRVNVGTGSEPLSIVCGATNIQVGQRVPVALPGAVLPGGRQISVSRIQGADSQGMLCSGDELGLTADADGILILDGGSTVGQPLTDIVGDTVLDLDVKPNRGDALSLIGLGREVAAISGGRVRWPEISVPEAGDSSADRVSVEVEDVRLCPRFVGRFMDGVMIGESPLAIQLRLSAAGLRPVSNVVDASNYVMLELGKPTHTFDAAAVGEGRIIVRRARSDERLESLDHVVRELTPDTLLIADPQGPIGIAGVIGGAASEVGPTTTAVIIESAVFDPISIRRTAQHYALRSEASLRFEKGQEWRLAPLGADRVAQLIAGWSGARPAVGAVDTNPSAVAPHRVVYRPARISRLIGRDLGGTEMRNLLQRIEIAADAPLADDRLVLAAGVEGRPLTDAERGDAQVAVVPPHRTDVSIEADVAEEVARLYGYERLPSSLPDTQAPAFRPDPTRATDALRDLLAGRGLGEVVTNGLVAPADHQAVGLALDDPATVRVANPVAADHSELRRSLLPGLLRVLRHNERQRREDVAIFELGAIHWAADGEAHEADWLGILLAGNWPAGSWSRPAAQAAVEDAKGLIEALATRLNIVLLEYRPLTAQPLVEHPGRTAAVFGGGPQDLTELGRVGELDPRYLAASDVRAERAVFALLDVARLLALADFVPRVDRLPRLPAAERDLAVVVGRDVAQLEIARVIRAEAGELLDGLTLFDRYHGPPLGPDEISLAYRLRFQPMEQALVEGELEEIMGRIGAALADRVAARVRGDEG